MKHFFAGLSLVCAFFPIFSAEPVDSGASSPDQAKVIPSLQRRHRMDYKAPIICTPEELRKEIA